MTQAAGTPYGLPLAQMQGLADTAARGRHHVMLAGYLMMAERVGYRPDDIYRTAIQGLDGYPKHYDAFVVAVQALLDPSAAITPTGPTAD